ncbi:MAG: DNA primase, partial [Chloroflexota bacterium]
MVAEVERHVAGVALASEKKKSEPPPLTPAEREEALAFLRSPDLLGRIVADMEELGYVGEEHNKLIGYLVGVSRKDRYPLSAVVLSQSGAGKSALAEAIEKLTPPEDVLLFSRLTPQALYYMERTALVHKLVIIEERHGAAAADYPIRVLQSRQSLTQAVPVKDPATGNIRTKLLTVDGPIAYIETTTDATIHPENATRVFELFLDESRAQTVRVHALQKRAKRESQEARAKRIDGIRRRHHNAQRLLEPIEARVPFSDHLRFPADSLRTRRDHPRFLNLIAGVAYLHQKQRQVQVDA